MSTMRNHKNLFRHHFKMQLFQIILNYVLLTGSFFKCLSGQRNWGLASFRVIKGYDISITKVPWQVSLHYNVKWWTYQFVCGGVIIGRREVLTAAHCFFFHNDPEFYRIRAGSTSKLQGGTFHNLQTIKIHQDYIFTTCQSEFDLAFVRVKEPFPFNRFSKPIPLANADPQDGEEVIVAGWGLSAPESHIHPDRLKAANFTIWQRNDCLPEDSPLQDDIFCLQSTTIGGNEFLCSGDSGGPVAKNNKLLGIITGVAPKMGKPQNLRCRPITREDLASITPIINHICNPLFGTSTYISIVSHRRWIRTMMKQTTSGG